MNSNRKKAKKKVNKAQTRYTLFVVVLSVALIISMIVPFFSLAF